MTAPILEAVIFDVDGTLADTERDGHRVAFNAALGAGLRTLVTVNGYTAREDFSGAVAVLSDLGEPEQPAAAVLKGSLNKQYVDAELLETWLKAEWSRDVAHLASEGIEPQRYNLPCSGRHHAFMFQVK